MESNNAFEIIARGVYIKQGKILLCKRIDRNYWFLPGGHVEIGERAEAALLREMKEETGLSLTRATFIGTMENSFFDEGEYIHEINLFFQLHGRVPAAAAIENHLAFQFFSLKDLHKIHLLPEELKSILPLWIKTKKPFFASHIEEKT